MQENKSNTQAIAISSLTLGIFAIVGSLIPVLNLVSCIIALVALGLGIAGIVKKQGGMAIAGTILAVCTFILAYHSYKAVGNIVMKSAENMETNLNLEGLEVTGSTLEASAGASFVTGTLTNHTGQDVAMPVVNYNALNDRGEQIGSCVDAMFGELTQGSTWNFSATCDVSEIPAKIEFVGATTPVSVK